MSMVRLSQQRQFIERIRLQSSLSLSHADQLKQSIASSWQRSLHANIPSDRIAAPLATTIPTSSLLQRALQHCQEELKHIALQSSMVMAIADMGSTIIWTSASSVMQNEAEKVHFIEGGQWQEEMVGTNALALSLKTGQSSSVFSVEHYMHSLANWVCYATPIIDPISQHIIGVIDLSTTWEHHNPLGLLAVERCAAILHSALKDIQKQFIFIQTFTTPKVIFNGKSVVLTPRQIEILTILALCPKGMSLDNLHHALYGERKVTLGTLKAEMSQLREILGGLLGSRPYRLLTQVDADFLHVEHALDAGYIESALNCYTGVFLSKTESPFLCAWRDCLESRLSEAIFKNQHVDRLLKHLAHFPDAVDAVERLLELMPAQHPIHHLLLHRTV